MSKNAMLLVKHENIVKIQFPYHNTCIPRALVRILKVLARKIFLLMEIFEILPKMFFAMFPSKSTGATALVAPVLTRALIVVHMDNNYNFTKFHQNQMKNKKVLLIARFSVQNFKAVSYTHLTLPTILLV